MGVMIVTATRKDRHRSSPWRGPKSTVTQLPDDASPTRDVVFARQGGGCCLAQLLCGTAASGAASIPVGVMSTCAMRRPGKLPGTLTEVTNGSADGTKVRSWWCLPREDHAPASLMLWCTADRGEFGTAGLEMESWLIAARGLRGMLPDPALSTSGYARLQPAGWLGSMGRTAVRPT